MKDRKGLSEIVDETTGVTLYVENGLEKKLDGSYRIDVSGFGSFKRLVLAYA